jgi:hypothetical protein
MGKATLVEPDIEAGAKLVKALERNDFPLSAALWIYTSDVDEWSLLVASPLVDKYGPHLAYKDLRDASGTKSPVPLSRITLVSDQNPLIELLRGAFSVQGGGIRLTSSSIDGVLIEDAYLYRTVPSEKATPERGRKPRAGLG